MWFGFGCSLRADGKPREAGSEYGWLYLVVVASERSGLAAGGSGIRIPHIRNF
jgi:hypothetical protein